MVQLVFCKSKERERERGINTFIIPTLPKIRAYLSRFRFILCQLQ